MQYFHVSWVKQIQEKQEKVDLLIYSDWQEEIKEVLNQYWVVILSIKEFTDTPENFWSVEFDFEHEWKTIYWIINKDKVRDWYWILINYWLDVTYINSLKSPIASDKVKLVLKKLQKEFRDVHAQKWQDKYSKYKKDTTKKKYSKKDEQKIKAIIDDTIQEYEILKENVKWHASWTYIKNAEDTVWELKKLKMWSNIEKMSRILETLFKQMQTIELNYISYCKKQEINEWSENIISELEFLFEYDKYEKTKKIKKMSSLTKTAREADDYYYSTLWKAWIYIKFLFKEAKNRLSNYNTVSAKLFELLEIFLIFVLIEFTLYYIYITKMTADWVSGIYFYILNIWLLGFLFFMIKFLKRENIFINISLLIICFVVFSILQNLISNTLAL